MAGFHVSYAGGKLVIGSLTIPNPAIKFVDEGPLEFWFDALVGDDVPVIDSLITYPRVRKGTRVDVPMMVGDKASTAGVAASNYTQQLATNIAALNAVVTSTTSGSGTTSVTYTPWVGASDRVFSAVILPPIRGRYWPGAGVKVVVPFILPTGPVT